MEKREPCASRKFGTEWHSFTCHMAYCVVEGAVAFSGKGVFGKAKSSAWDWGGGYLFSGVTTGRAISEPRCPHG